MSAVSKNVAEKYLYIILFYIAHKSTNLSGITAHHSRLVILLQSKLPFPKLTWWCNSCIFK